MFCCNQLLVHAGNSPKQNYDIQDFHVIFLQAPSDFKPGTIIKVEQGMSLRAVSLKLKEEKSWNQKTILLLDKLMSK